MAKAARAGRSKPDTPNHYPQWRVLISLAVIIILALFSLQDTFARIAWHKYNNPDVALLLNSKDKDLAIEIGNHYYGNGRYDLKRAEKSFLLAIKLDPDILWSHYQLARIYFVQQKFELASAEINQELASHPENLRSLYMRGLISAYLGRLAESEKDFYRFTEWAPKEWAGYNDLSWVLMKQKKYREARDLLKKALAKLDDGEKNPWLWNSLGVAELNLKEPRKAESAFKKAQALAETMDNKAWQRAYPGNDPQTADDGIRQFKEVISDNLRKARNKS